MGWLESTHPDDRQRSADVFLGANAARRPYSLDYRLRCHDGSYRWFIDAGLPRVNAAGEPDGFVGTVIDVHARKQLQERFEWVSEAGDIGVWYADAPFTHLQVNAQMGEHFGVPDAPLALYAHRHRVTHVLSNLINNAAKYTPPGGAITVAAAIDDEEIAITVSDNGIGLSEEALGNVFDMYAQVDTGAGMAQGGLGVGLNLVQRLVRLHGGRVVATSAGIGAGSQFTIWLPLPLDAVMPESLRELARPARVPDQQDGALRILVVDDNVDAAETLHALLDMHGHAVTSAHDGASALLQAAAILPQIVFLDIGLPDMSGHEAAEAMRRIEGMEGATLVALTGWGAEQDRQRSSQAGFDHHLTKPADFGIVEGLIRDVAAGQ